MLRFSRLFCACAASLMLAVPAYAQRTSLADRVSALEARSNDSSTALAMLDQMTLLREELQNLRAQLEELQHQQQQLGERARVQYLDVDGRLSRLEGTQTPAAPEPTDAANANASTQSNSTAPSAPAHSTGVAANSSASPSLPPLTSAGQDQAESYRAALQLLQSGRHADASRAFNAFLERWPQGAYAANAMYWLGESYYVTQNYNFALEQFQLLLRNWPEHDKASGALLKAAMAYQGLRQNEQAAHSYQQLLQRYPRSDAARIAENRLRILQSTGE